MRSQVAWHSGRRAEEEEKRELTRGEPPQVLLPWPLKRPACFHQFKKKKMFQTTNEKCILMYLILRKM